jgi:hypothetical protein
VDKAGAWLFLERFPITSKGVIEKETRKFCKFQRAFLGHNPKPWVADSDSWCLSKISLLQTG